MELSKILREYSRTIAGKEQLLIAAIAKGLEIIPRQLCDNAGFDATNILNKLRQKHAQGKFYHVTRLYSENLVELRIPAKIVTQGLISREVFVPETKQEKPRIKCEKGLTCYLLLQEIHM